MPVVLIVFLVGVVLVLFGIGKTLLKKTFDKGIWFVGIGTVLTVLALLLTAGYNNTAYYPSNTDIQSSLTLANSCSSQFTLKTMAYVSILVPFVIAYIFYAWRSIDNRKIDAKEMDEGGHKRHSTGKHPPAGWDGSVLQCRKEQAGSDKCRRKLFSPYPRLQTLHQRFCTGRHGPERAVRIAGQQP